MSRTTCFWPPASVAAHAGIAGYAAYGPPGTEDFFRHTLPAAIGLIDAWLPNFGDCLLHTIGEIFARGHGSAVVLNSDSPTLPTALLIETAEVLARPGDRAVLGPSSDGGYYLLGLKPAHRAHVRGYRLEHGTGRGIRRWSAPARSGSKSIPCRCGMMSTMSTACAGFTPNLRGEDPGRAPTRRCRNRITPAQTAKLMATLWR